MLAFIYVTPLPFQQNPEFHKHEEYFKYKIKKKIVGKSSKKVNENKSSLPQLYKYNLFFDVKKKGTLGILQPSLHFNGLIILVKTQHLCKGMAAIAKSYRESQG